MGFWEKLNKIGIFVPMVADPSTGKPSASLLGVYSALVLCIISLIAGHFVHHMEAATGLCLIFYVLTSVLYVFRNAQRAKINLKDESIDLEEDNNKEEEKK